MPSGSPSGRPAKKQQSRARKSRKGRSSSHSWSTHHTERLRSQGVKASVLSIEWDSMGRC
jgi:hypothetical protein